MQESNSPSFSSQPSTPDQELVSLPSPYSPLYSGEKEKLTKVEKRPCDFDWSEEMKNYLNDEDGNEVPKEGSSDGSEESSDDEETRTPAQDRICSLRTILEDGLDVNLDLDMNEAAWLMLQGMEEAEQREAEEEQGCGRGGGGEHRAEQY